MLVLRRVHVVPRRVGCLPELRLEAEVGGGVVVPWLPAAFALFGIGPSADWETNSLLRPANDSMRPPRPRAPSPRPRSQAITPPAPHPAAPLEPQAQPRQASSARGRHRHRRRRHSIWPGRNVPGHSDHHGGQSARGEQRQTPQSVQPGLKRSLLRPELPGNGRYVQASDGAGGQLHLGDRAPLLRPQALVAEGRCCCRRAAFASTQSSAFARARAVGSSLPDGAEVCMRANHRLGTRQKDPATCSRGRPGSLGRRPYRSIAMMSALTCGSEMK